VLTVIATVQAKPGKERQLEQELFLLVPFTVEEQGCINYDLLKAVEIPGKFVFYENWESKQDLDRHLASEHVRSFLTRADGLLASPVQIELYEMAD
jgi:quinol monooxygenase YgiN